MAKMNPAMPAAQKFSTASAFRKWLAKHHSTSDGLWMVFSKKTAKEKTLTYAEALDQALCFGWIDSQKKSLDANFFLQKFTPRRAKSLWSKVNIRHVERLTKSKKMHSSGLEQVRRAKADGRWEKAYDAFSKSEIPLDLLSLLEKYKKAFSFFKTLNRTNVYAITWRLQTAAKSETRQRRLEQILQMLLAGESFHPQKKSAKPQTTKPKAKKRNA